MAPSRWPGPPQGRPAPAAVEPADEKKIGIGGDLLIPLWGGARYFFMDPSAGVYGAAELGLNVLVPTTSNGNAGDSLTRIGANLGVGYVIGKELPIDIRAQFQIYNLLLEESSDRDAHTPRRSKRRSSVMSAMAQRTPSRPTPEPLTPP